MALAVRAYFEAYATDETKYRVRIWEEGFVGTSIELTPSRAMFTLTYKPLSNDLAANMAPSVADVEFYIQNDDERTLISDIVEYQQTNFYLTIDQDLGDTGTYSSYWKGVVIQDQISEKDAFNGLFILKCVDGLSRLKDIPYNFANETTVGDFSFSSVFQILYNAFAEALPLELWGTSDSFMITTVNWWCNDQTYSATADPLVDHLFDVQALTEVVDKFNFSFFQYRTCFEVLEIFAKTYLCRVYMADGAYHFEQITERRNANIKKSVYLKTGSAYTSSLVAITVPIDQTRESARLAGNTFNRFAALKRVTVEQTPYNSARPTSFDWDLVSGAFSSSESLDFGLYGRYVENTPIASFLAQSVKVEVYFNYSAQYAFSTSDAVLYYGSTYLYGLRTVIDVEIKLEDANSATTYYFDGVNWQTTSQVIEKVGGFNYVYGTNTSAPTLNSTTAVNNNIIRTINTAPLPATGRITVTVSNHRTQKLSSVGPFGFTTLASGFTLTGSFIKTSLSTKYPTSDAVRFFNIENTNANIADFEIADLGTILIGDGSLQTGHLFIEDALGDYQPAKEWDYANESRALSLAGLLTTERLGLQREVIEVYNGRLMMPQGYDKNISFDSTRWIPLQYTFVAGSGIVNADYFAIERYTVSEDYGQDLGNNLGLDFQDDDKQYKFGGIPIGNGQVSDTFYGSDQTIQTNNLRSQKALRGQVTDLTASDGGSYSASEDEHILFLQWSGATGTYELTLPEVSADIKGQQIEIVIDENFTSETFVTVLPSGTDTIRGETEVTISGGGDFHFFFRAMNSGWY